METGSVNTSGRRALSHRIHRFLAQSYLTFFILFLVGIVLDLIFPLHIFNRPAMLFGFALLFLSSLLIVWAQRTARRLDGSKAEDFEHGPYAFTRSPTHWGLFLLVLGFGIVANAFFIFLSTIISFIVSKLVFLKREEEVLAEKYGAPYLEYKSKVRL